MRRAWKLYDKCYCEISAIGGPFLMWAPELRGVGNGADLQSDLDEVEEALDEVHDCNDIQPYTDTASIISFFEELCSDEGAG